MENLNDLLQTLKLELSDAQLNSFARFKELLVQANSKTNLTRIAPNDIDLLHFVDSLYTLKALPETTEDLKCIDIGTGAGFPGIPLAIACKHLRITLIDSSKRKVDFLEYALLKLGLKNCQALHARAEDLAEDPDHSEQYDFAFARAVSDSTKLTEMSFPLLRPGGTLIALKGPAEERTEGSIAYHLPGTKIERILQPMRK